MKKDLNRAVHCALECVSNLLTVFTNLVADYIR